MDIESLPDIDRGEITDGYHTFNELYEHRNQLYLAFCRLLDAPETGLRFCLPVWKSRIHSDGSSYEGWFVVGVGKDKGGQITYHLPDRLWDDAPFAELPRAPEYDGHTPNDVLERLKNL